jgi:hypothetical protein
LARVTGIVVLLLVLTWSGSGGAAPHIDDRFKVRHSWNETPGIPGEALNGSPAGSTQKRKSKLTMNVNGGGRQINRALAGEESCNLPEKLAAALHLGNLLCANLGTQKIPLFDVSVFPKRYFPTAVAQRRYGQRGWGADELRTPEDVAAAVEESAGQQLEDNPFLFRLDPIPARYEATTDLLSNPVTRPSARRMLIENFVSLSGATPVEGVVDPRGRPATLIHVPDTSRAGVIEVDLGYEVRTYDLRNAAELRLQLFYNPQTFDILADRVQLLSTNVPELQTFIESAGSNPPALVTNTFVPVKRVRRPALTSYRIPCHKVEDPDPRDRFCVHVGPLNSDVGLRRWQGNQRTATALER